MARSAWLKHVMAVKAKNKGMAFKDVLKQAKKSYRRVGGGIASNAFELESGGAPPAAGKPVQQTGGQEGEQEGGSEGPQEGGRRHRRRRSRKSRRKSRKSRRKRRKSRRKRKTKRRRRRRR
tara:strand:- start:298 stop:660 length:363 start_codon:yes stop_codon:yes gene_type:complete